VREGGFANGAFKQEHLVGKFDRVAVQQVDFKLRRATFLNDGVDLQVLAFSEIVDVVDDLVVLINCAEAIRLTPSALPARTASRWL
jgi:hypothetical protein